ncbi:MAG: hypothetical protein LBK47_01905 [Prevotellaceae bacterium]|nr:hypothetical protein [Prevotellaceae bacterium]
MTEAEVPPLRCAEPAPSKVEGGGMTEAEVPPLRCAEPVLSEVEGAQ